MVFYVFTMALKTRHRDATVKTIKELSNKIYDHGGVIRKMSHEGIMRPYSKFRDVNNEILTYARYWVFQVDLGEEHLRPRLKEMREHADLFVLFEKQMERPMNLKHSEGFTTLDYFTRLEEEIQWPPQVSGDVYEQMEMNWKEFSKNRWSSYLRQ